MEIRKTNCLTQEERSQVLKLEQEVLKQENLHNRMYLSNDLNAFPEMNCFFLGYDEGVLTALLFIFATERDMAEVQAYVRREYRNQGHFRQLLGFAEEELFRFGIRRIQLAVEETSESGKKVLESFTDAKPDRTEYCMRRTVSKEREALLPPGVTIVSVKELPKDMRRRAASEIYRDIRDLTALMEAVLHDSGRDMWILFHEGCPAAACAVRYTDDVGGIHALEVAEKYRRRGYAQLLLTYIMNQEGLCSWFELDVDSKNPPALALYRKLQFREWTEVSYWEYDSHCGSGHTKNER